MSDPVTSERPKRFGDISISNLYIFEDNALGQSIGDLSSFGKFAGVTGSFSLAVGDGDTDNASFAVSGSSLVAAAVFDYETKRQHSVRVRFTNDEGRYAEAKFTVTAVYKVEDAPASEAGRIQDYYHEANGPNWDSKDNWFTSGILNEWSGIGTSSNHVSSINFNSVGGMSGSILSLNPYYFPNLTTFQLRNSPNVSGDIADFKFGDLLTMFRIETLPLVTGDLTNWTFSNVLVRLYLRNCGLSGNISKWAFSSAMDFVRIEGNDFTGRLDTWYLVDGMGYFDVYNNRLNGYPKFAAGDLSGLGSSVKMQNNNISNHDLDLFLELCYSRRLDIPYGAQLDISGNAVPSGNYENVTTPTKGKEFIYKLVNNPDAEAFTGWAITYDS